MNDLMSQAVDLMIAGMGFVFVFLIILVFATLPGDYGRYPA